MSFFSVFFLPRDSIATIWMATEKDDHDGSTEEESGNFFFF